MRLGCQVFLQKKCYRMSVTEAKKCCNRYGAGFVVSNLKLNA
jgi:hypothetical protein